MTDSDPGRLHEIGYVILWVRDMDRSIAFFRDVLGVPTKQESPGWTELDTGGTTLALHPVEDPAAAAEDAPGAPAIAPLPNAPEVVPRPGTPEVVFHVGDVRATHAAIRERGGELGELREVWRADGIVGVSAEIRDPDGNALSIHGTVPTGEWG